MRFSLPIVFATVIALTASVYAAAPDLPTHDSDVQSIVNGISTKRLEKTIHTLAAFPTRHTLSGEKGADAAALWLQQEFQAISTESGGRLQVVRDTWTQPAGTRMPAPAALTNVIATLPGDATPERVVVISGHYDSRVTDVMDAIHPAPGANDDGSGVAVVLELARAMALSKRHFAATVVFATVTGEEQGLYGSAHLAQTMQEQKRNVIAMLDNDIVGNSRGEDGKKDDSHVRVFSAGYDPGVAATDLARQRAAGTDADSPARTLARAVRDAARRYVPDFGVELVYRNDRYGRGGDHSSFLNQGYPFAVRLTEPNEDWRHQHQDVRTENGVAYGDLPEFVDFRYLTRVAQVNASLIADLAAAPVAPIVVRMAPDLSAKTTLTWNPLTQPDDVAGYEVLIRRTTAPDWETSVRTPAEVTRLVLPYSKDDYLFAVRAIGKSGAYSLPTLPVAGRN